MQNITLLVFNFFTEIVKMAMMLRALVLTVVLIQVAVGRKFSYCDFVRQLRKHGVPNNHEVNECKCSYFLTVSLKVNRNVLRSIVAI